VESLSFETLVAHSDYARLALLSLLVLVARGRFVRLVVALLAGLELAFAIADGDDRAALIWAAIVLGLAVLILLVGVIAGGMARLNAEEQAMSNHLLKGVSRSRARHFIDQGYWLSGSPGEVLLREGEPVKQFCYLGAGEARVMMGGRAIGFCRDGDVIGGLGFFSGETSAATVVLASPARFWVAPHERLKPYFDAHPELKTKIRRTMAEPPPEPAHPDEASDLLPSQTANPVIARGGPAL
jgi:hypothetical protein